MALDTDASISVATIYTGGTGKSARDSIARADDDIVAQVNYSGIDNDIDIVFQQSLDGTNWDGIMDHDGQAFKIELKKCAGVTSSGTVIRNLIGFYATYLRAVIYIKKATVGTINLLIDV